MRVVEVRCRYYLKGHAVGVLSTCCVTAGRNCKAKPQDSQGQRVGETPVLGEFAHGITYSQFFT